MSFISTTQAQWTDQPSTLFSNSILWSVQVLDANNVWAVAYYNNQVVKTTNGGSTWTALPVNDPTFADFNIESIAVIDANTAWLTASYTTTHPYQTRIYKTTNGGATWQRQTTAYPVADGSWAYANHFFDANNGVNIGEKWIPVSGSSMYTTIPEILTTSNGGTNWNSVSLTNLPNTSEGIDYRAFSVVSNTIWYIGNDSWIYKSSDKGLTWSVTDPGFPISGGLIVQSIAFTDANNGLACSRGTLKRTNDGGATWVTVNAIGPWNSYEIVPVPGSASTYISAGRYIGDAGSSITHDNGNTWVNLETTIQHFDLKFINPTTGWSGGYAKMYKLNTNALGAPQEIATTNSFFIYPNPGKGNFNITSASEEPFTLEVYDLIGNKVYQQEGNAFGKSTIDLSSQKKGIYLLHILSKEQRIIEKIVLQ